MGVPNPGPPYNSVPASQFGELQAMGEEAAAAYANEHNGRMPPGHDNDNWKQPNASEPGRQGMRGWGSSLNEGDDEEGEERRGPNGPDLPGPEDLPNYTLFGRLLALISQR